MINIDPRTRHFVFIRGLPGSGKTRLARQLQDAASRLANKPGSWRSELISADDFFEVGEEYRFDPSQLPLAHADCMKRTLEALQTGVDLVIVHNTGTEKWEYENYLIAARMGAYKYSVDLLEMPCDDRRTLRKYMARQTHAVPTAGVGAMFARWEDDSEAKKVEATK